MSVELLALYGEDGQSRGVAYLEDGTPVIFGEEEPEEIGSIFGKLKRGMKKAARFTPQYQLAMKASQLLKRKGRKVHGEDAVYIEGEEVVYVYGEDSETLGKFLPGLMKAVKKVGKVTSKITTGLARAVGVPQSAINALAKVDPTKKMKPGAAVAALIPAAGGPVKEVIAVPASASKFDFKKVAIIGGAGLGALIVLKIVLGATASRRS